MAPQAGEAAPGGGAGAPGQAAAAGGDGMTEVSIGNGQKVKVTKARARELRAARSGATKAVARRTVNQIDRLTNKQAKLDARAARSGARAAKMQARQAALPSLTLP